MSNSAFSPSVLTIPSGTTGSGGQGELNLITNPVAAVNLDGWVGAGRGTSGGPLNPTIETYFTVLNTAGSESSTSGAYDVLSLPSGLQNKKLKVEFYFTSPALDTFKVSVYKGTTRVPLTTDVSGSTALPQNTTGKFVAYFDTDSSGTWTVSITRTAGTGSTALQFTNVVVGPGIQPQGAVVGEWQSYTPTWTGFGSKTITLSSGKYRRVGSNIELMFAVNGNSTASGGGATTVSLSLPSGLTVNSSVAGAGDVGNFGAVQTYGITTAAVYDYTTQAINGTTSDTVRFVKVGSGTAYSAADLNVARSVQLEGLLSIPIAEWAGSGTVQLAQNDVTYYYGTGGTWGTTATVVTAQGPGGVLGGTTTPAGNSFYYSIVPTTPIQVGSVPELQVSTDQKNWSNVVGNWAGAGSLETFNYLSGTAYVGAGAYLYTDGSIRAVFGKYVDKASTAWSGTWYWRVKVASPGAAVGFGIVAPGVSSGLVSASGLPGNTTGNAIASGYVGEVITASLSNVSIAVSNTTYNAGLLSLPAGTWLVFGKVMWSASSGSNATFARVGISTTSATEDALSSTMLTNTTTNDVRIASNPKVVSTTGQTVYLVFRAGFTGTATSTDATQSTFYAVRIA